MRDVKTHVFVTGVNQGWGWNQGICVFLFFLVEFCGMMIRTNRCMLIIWLMKRRLQHMLLNNVLLCRHS